jgi:hypothetical protein
LSFETGCHSIAQAGFELAVLLLSLPGAEITSMHHHAWLKKNEIKALCLVHIHKYIRHMLNVYYLKYGIYIVLCTAPDFNNIIDFDVSVS